MSVSNSSSNNSGRPHLPQPPAVSAPPPEFGAGVQVLQPQVMQTSLPPQQVHVLPPGTALPPGATGGAPQQQRVIVIQGQPPANAPHGQPFSIPQGVATNANGMMTLNTHQQVQHQGQAPPPPPPGPTATHAAALAAGMDTSNGTLTVIDPLSRKIGIPLKDIYPTRALQRNAATMPLLPSLCMLFMENRCRQGSDCNQIHADTAVVFAIRQAASQLPTCCQFHGDINKHLFNQFPNWVGSNLLIDGVMIPVEFVAFTKGLQRSLTGAFSHHRAEKMPVSVSATFVCRLQAGGHCRYSEECKFVHLCREVSQQHLSHCVFPLVTPDSSQRNLRSQHQQQQQQQHSHAVKLGIPSSAQQQVTPGLNMPPAQAAPHRPPPPQQQQQQQQQQQPGQSGQQPQALSPELVQELMNLAASGSTMGTAPGGGSIQIISTGAPPIQQQQQQQQPLPAGNGQVIQQRQPVMQQQPWMQQPAPVQYVVQQQ